MPAALDPTDVTVTPLTARTVRVDWTDNAAAEDFYQVEYYDGTWNISSSTIAADSETYEVSGLDPHTVYNFRVTALDTANGDSAAVESGEFYTFPEIAGDYYAYESSEITPVAWSWILKLSGQSPFFTVSGVKIDHSANFGLLSGASRSANPLDITTFRFGPAITVPTFVAL